MKIAAAFPVNPAILIILSAEDISCPDVSNLNWTPRLKKSSVLFGQGHNQEAFFLFVPFAQPLPNQPPEKGAAGTCCCSPSCTSWRLAGGATGFRL